MFYLSLSHSQLTSNKTGKEGTCSTAGKIAGAKVTAIAKGWDFTVINNVNYVGGVYVNETWLTDAVANVGPISACLDVSDKLSTNLQNTFTRELTWRTVYSYHHTSSIQKK